VFLSHLASERDVASSTQNQALSALLFLYGQVLGVELPWMKGIERAKHPVRVPVVLTRDELRALLARLDETKWLMAALLYGAGLRLRECLKLRVKDLDFGYRQITVRDGKGARDRVTMLPAELAEPLRSHLARAKSLHERDLAGGARSAHRQAGRQPHAAPLIRHSPAGGRLRHPYGAGAARALGCLDDHDLHPRAQQGRAGRRRPARPPGIERTRLTPAADATSPAPSSPVPAPRWWSGTCGCPSAPGSPGSTAGRPRSPRARG